MEEQVFICDYCACKDVCKFVEQHRQVHTAVNDLVVYENKNEADSRIGIVKISDIPWLKKPIDLHCIHFYRDNRKRNDF